MLDMVGTSTHPTQVSSLPNLPRLTWPQCRAVFKQCGVSNVVISQLSGITRRSIWRWELPPGEGRTTPTPESMDIMSVLAYSCLRALRLKALPMAKPTLTRVLEAIQQPSSRLPPLKDCTPEQLLPPSWLKK